MTAKSCGLPLQRPQRSACWHSWCSTHPLDHFHKLLCIPLQTHVGCTDYLLFQRLNHVHRTKAGSWQDKQPCLHRQSASMAKTHTLKSTYFPINGQSQRTSNHGLMWAQGGALMSINDEEQLCDMVELQDKIVGDFTASAMHTDGTWGPQPAHGAWDFHLPTNLWSRKRPFLAHSGFQQLLNIQTKQHTPLTPASPGHW